MVGLGPLPSTNSTETFYFFFQTREKYASISSGTTRLIMCGQWKCVYFFIRNYNRGKKKAVSREEAMEELIQVVTTCLFRRVIPMHSNTYIEFQVVDPHNSKGVEIWMFNISKLWTKLMTHDLADKINKTRQVYTAHSREERWLCASRIWEPHTGGRCNSYPGSNM